jgi:cell division protein FtsN
MINYRNTHSNKHRNKQRQPSSRQTGGTLLGIIIGLIVGLAIALGVAVTITKTSLPFLNKQGKPEKASELTPGQVSDPNRPLYGSKEAAREAAKDFAKSAETPAPAGITPVPADKPAVDKPVAVKPLVIKPAENKDAAAAAKPESADDKWSYYLQAGAFREQTDAENTRAKLALAGVEASISERPSEGGSTLYRVRVGPFNQLEAMNRVRSKLSDNGVDVAVVRIAK